MSKPKPPLKKAADKAQARPKTAPLKKASKATVWLALAAVLALTLVSYFPTIFNGFTNFDDPRYVSDNPMLAHDKAVDYFAKDKFVMGNFHPLTMISLSMEYAVAKLNPKVYHIDNLILHLLNTALVFCIIFLLLGSWQGAAIVAALFGVHPMHVESVAWVSERKDVLYTFFYFASLVAYMYYIRNKKPAYYAGALGLFILSLLSKGQAVTLPLTMLLMDYFTNRKFTSKTLIEKTPFFALSLIFGIIALVAQHSSKAIFNSQGFGFNSFLYAGYGLADYLLKFVAPLNLSCFYPYPPANAALPVIFYIAPVVVIGLAALVYFKFRANKTVVFGALFFLLNIAPVLQLLPVGGAITSDRYSYIPYVGLCFIVAQAVMYFYGYNINDGLKARKATVPSPYKNVALTVVVLVICVFAYAGNQRSRVWKDSATLWENMLANHPGVGRIYDILANVYYEQSKSLTAQNNNAAATPLLEKAMGDFRKCVDIEPDNYDALRNLGLGYTTLGKYDSAVRYLTQAVRVEPKTSIGWVNRSIAYRSEGRADSALADINRAIALTPDSAFYYTSRANVYFSKGQYRDAIKDYKINIAAGGGKDAPYKNMGHCYNRLGMYDSAIYYYDKALSLDPQNEDTYKARGLANSSKADYNDAIKDYTTALNMNAADAQAYSMRSEAYFHLQDKKAALADALQAKKLGYPVQDSYLAKLAN